MIKTLIRYKSPYLFILPFFILFFVFQLIPFLWTVVISFTEWNGIGSPRPAGLFNYTQMLKDDMFWESFFNTFVYWISGFCGIIVFAVVTANLLNFKNLNGRTVYKTILFLPNVCAAIAMGLIFRMIFDDNVGLINEALAALGGQRIPWLTSTSFSKIPVIFLNIWRNTPWFTMIVLSGLLNIPSEYYEAATVDGANIFQQFFKITLPSLRNILFFCFITVTVDSWKLFNESYILPGPGTSNTSLFQYMYESGFRIFKMGYASALGVVLIGILLIISSIQFFAKKRSGEL